MSKSIRYDQTVLGNARYSTLEEIKASGLMQGKGGFVFGQIQQKLVSKPENFPGHILIVGGPGIGKSKAVAIPTLLKWEGSILAVDVKGELQEITAKHRKGQTYIFNPIGEGDPYDPLYDCKTVEGAQDLARTLIPVPPDSPDPFWCNTAQGILAAGALEGALEGITFSDVIERMCTVPTEQLISELQQSQYKAVRVLSSVGVGIPEKTLGGVMAQLKSSLLTLGADPNIEKCTSFASWTPETLEHNSTIYLNIPEKVLKQYRSLWTLIVNQVLRHLSGRPEDSEHPILILLDEFARLGKIESIMDALATLRSRNVHIALFIQSMAQLEEIYGQTARKVIADTCSYKLVFGAEDPETQKYFSDLSGQRTVWVGSQGQGQGTTIGAGWLPNLNDNSSQGLVQQGTPLIRPEDFRKLQHPILFASTLYPAAVGKAFYNSVPATAEILGIEVPKDKLKQADSSYSKYQFNFKSFAIICLISFVVGLFLFHFELSYLTKHYYDFMTPQTAEEIKNFNELKASLKSPTKFITELFTAPGALGVYGVFAFLPSLGITALARKIIRRFKK